jgi:Xaa-Pro aminopeptidase
MNRLIYAASECDADLFYATKFLAPDAFLYFQKAGRSYIVLNPLEYDRGRKEACVDKVINQAELSFKRKGSQQKSKYDWIVNVLKEHRFNQAYVSSEFPLGLGDFLRKNGIKLFVAEEGLFPQRTIKIKNEIAAIRKSLKVTAQLIDRGISMIRRSRPNSRKELILSGRPLTSELVQAEIRTEAARLGFKAEQPIVAGGVQACDPHERGHGKLKANEFIILDIFPRDLTSGYWGDMTRTVIKGRASEAQKRQFDTVHQAQKLAIKKIKSGITGKEIHDSIVQLFDERGYRTSNASGRYEGFFHGTGHGLGLEIHESPRVNAVGGSLRAGHVVTVEPGLYYSQVGGVRIEDVVVVRSGKCELLSHYPVQLVI